MSTSRIAAAIASAISPTIASCSRASTVGLRSRLPERGSIAQTRAICMALLALLLTACTSSAPIAPAAAVGPPVTVSGSRTMKTTSFTLTGDYKVVWSATADSDAGCFHGVTLERADGTTTFDTLTSGLLHGAGVHTGTTNEYGLAPASYYLDASSGCGSWSFTFTPK